MHVKYYYVVARSVAKIISIEHISRSFYTAKNWSSTVAICNMYKAVHASDLVNHVYKKILPGTACMYIVGTVGLTYPNRSRWLLVILHL